MPSGIMGNQIALHLHGRPGGEVICEAQAHMVGLEMGSMAALSGLMPRPVGSTDGLLAAADIERVIAPDVTYSSRTALLAIENTHRAGGRIYRRPRLDELLAVAKKHGYFSARRALMFLIHSFMFVAASDAVMIAKSPFSPIARAALSIRVYPMPWGVA